MANIILFFTNCNLVATFQSCKLHQMFYMYVLGPLII